MITAYITRPNGSKPTALLDRVTALWRRAAGTTHDLRFVEAKPYTTHGETLTTQYAGMLCEVPRPQKFLFSELDFVPHPRSLDILDSALDEFEVVCPMYANRQPNGALIYPPPRQGLSCMDGAWYFAGNLGRMFNLPPLNTFDAAGPCNDACNLATLRLFEAGCINRDSVDYLDVIDHYHDTPKFLGLTYPPFGTHAFYQRHFDDDPSLCLHNDYTVADHLAAFAHHVSIYERL